MEGTFDTDTNILQWTVTYSGLATAPIGAHFHGPVSYLGLTPEENAPIQVATPGNLASPFHGEAKIDDAQAHDLKDGRWYFNLHSKQYPGGEIRGPCHSPLKAGRLVACAQATSTPDAIGGNPRT